ncbi:hypothetical protein ACFWMG_04940 [Streptomyces sp. NPDC127074]|uniref:hypothetical protein n=1 Tax=Streptomyces sp. NPDC127074 TaxID=3347130 RepID=UPI0036565DC4
MFGRKCLSEKLDELPAVIAEIIKNELAGVRDKLGSAHDAARDASNSAASASRGVNDLHSEMQRLGAEVARLRAALETLHAGPAEAHTTAAPDSDTEDDFDELLALAAGIAYAEITCHRDTWDFLVTQSSGGQHFRLPGFVEETDCLINADVSGRTLIAVLDALWRTRHDPATDPGTRHLATKIYGRIGDALRQIEASEPEPGRSVRFRRDDPPVAHIVIDDRPPAETSG